MAISSYDSSWDKTIWRTILMKTKIIVKDSAYYITLTIMGIAMGLSLCPSVISYIRSI